MKCINDCTIRGDRDIVLNVDIALAYDVHTLLNVDVATNPQGSIPAKLRAMNYFNPREFSNSYTLAEEHTTRPDKQQRFEDYASRSQCAKARSPEEMRDKCTPKKFEHELFNMPSGIDSSKFK